MMTRLALLALAASLSMPGPALAQPAAPDPQALVRRMDDVLTFKTRVADATLTIERPGAAPDVKTLRMWSRGWEDTYSEFLSPARDKGVRYLKLERNLYMYLPRTEKVVKISGHLLRQSVMDSDFSYEDMLETRALVTDYDAKLLGEETLDGQKTWVLDLTARKPDVTYSRRKTWIAQDTHVPIRAEWYARSGVLLKVLTMGDVIAHGDRRYPTRMEMADQARGGGRSVLRLSNVQLDPDIPAARFSRRQLMKGG